MRLVLHSVKSLWAGWAWWIGLRVQGTNAQSRMAATYECTLLNSKRATVNKLLFNIFSIAVIFAAWFLEVRATAATAAPSFIWLCSTPAFGDHGEGQVLAVLALDRGDKSPSTPEDSLPVSKLGTSLSRPCHILPCRSPTDWASAAACAALLLSPPEECQILLCIEERTQGERRGA